MQKTGLNVLIQIFLIAVVFFREYSTGATDDDQPLKNSWYWSTEATQTKSFNDVFF